MHPASDASESLRPYAPMAVAGSRSSGDLTIIWIRRTRIGGDDSWQDGVTEVPLGEATEAYSIDILNGSTVVRTLSSSSPSVVYSSADQTTDFGSPQSSISVNIYQLSATVGRGFAASATV
jgi:hypothetical protein